MSDEMFDLDFVQDDVSRLLRKQGINKSPKAFHHWRDFFGRATYACSLILREKEILTFALLQWVVIALVYYLWVQIFGWIPMEVWESEGQREGILLNIAFAGWGFACVALAAFPIGVLTGCIGAAHLLHQQGVRCTIAGCLATVVPRAGSLWALHTADGWITVWQIMERIPRKRRHSLPVAERAASELAYYAWKLGTVGMVPAIVSGHDMRTAAKQSVSLAKHKLSDVALLRGGYSAACWTVAIAACVGAIAFFIVSPGLSQAGHPIFSFYLSWIGAPILAAAAAVSIVLRPIFVISACRLYADFVKEQRVPVPRRGADRLRQGFGGQEASRHMPGVKPEPTL